MADPERTDAALAPRSVGIVGAGQLARMLCEAASPLGVRTVVLAERGDDAAATSGDETLVGSPMDPDALARLAAACDVVTFDHELVDLESVSSLEARGLAIRPGSDALVVAVDKAVQRRRFAAAGLPVPAFAVLDGELSADLDALRAFAERTGAAPVVKAARGGYDGRGVVLATTLDEALDATEAWRRAGIVVVAEAKVNFRNEIAALVARRPGGETAAWQPVETAQLDGVCREIRVPGGVGVETASAAATLARRVAALIGVVGVLAVELFDLGGELVINEVAVRPHNSGHWTIEGARTSQFENHLRAVLDLPLGDTEVTAPAITSVNVFGGPDPAAVPALAAALDDPGVKVHLYGKASRPGRKLGHVTALGEEQGDTDKRAWSAAESLGSPRPRERGASS